MNPARHTQDDLIKLQFALPADQWIILIRPEADDPAIRNIIPRRSLFKMADVNWLRYRNAHGCHIYGRPNSTRFILVDWDEDAANGLQLMKSDGLNPTAVIETSPAKFQAWLSVSDTELPIPVATALAKLIARRYHADPGSADALHPGRLPGLRNKKPKYRTYPGDGGPLALLRTALHAPRIPDRMDRLIREAEMAVECAPPPSARRGRVSQDIEHLDIDPSRSPMTQEEANEIYAAELQYQVERTNENLLTEDRSKADYAVTYGLHSSYGYDPDDLAALLMYASDKAAERGLEYIERTVRAAYSAS